MSQTAETDGTTPPLTQLETEMLAALKDARARFDHIAEQLEQKRTDTERAMLKEYANQCATDASMVVRNLERFATPHRFQEISCSQCGQGFGSGNYGYSHCADHRQPHPTKVIREFENELGNKIKITIEGPTSETELFLTSLEAKALSEAVYTHQNAPESDQLAPSIRTAGRTAISQAEARATPDAGDAS